MASLQDIYIKKETLQTLVSVLEKKGANGISLTISISEEVNQYDQNVSAYVSQSKEERDAKKPRYYVGNGKTFWTDGKIVVPQKATAAAPPVSNDDNDDLPF